MDFPKTLIRLKVFLVLVALVAASPAEAKKKVSAKDKAKAKTAYLEANKLYKAEEYALALPLYQKAYELSGHRPSTILALAQCERMNKLYESAITRFNEYLATKPDKKQVTRVNETIKILEKLLAQAKAEEEEREKKAKADEERRRKETEQLAKELAKQMAVPAPPPPGPGIKSESSDSSILSSPWLWIGIGVLAAGAGTTAYLMTTGSQEEYGGTTGRIISPP